MDQQIRFCTTVDGARIAYTTLGAGPPLVVPPGWISHLELDLEEPSRRNFFQMLARHCTLVRYDRHGCGLSDRDRTDFSLEADVQVLTAVIDHLKLKRVALLGASAGGRQAIIYTADYPRRVTHLALYGTFARVNPDQLAFRAAIMTLVRANWGVGSKTLADLFVPNATADEAQWFARFQRAAASAETAARLIEVGGQQDVRDLLPRIRVPTLVMHRDKDRVVPFESGRELAAMIPKARFARLSGQDHLPNRGDVDSLVRTLAEFLGDPADPPHAPGDAVVPDPTQAREQEPEQEQLVTGYQAFISYAAEDRTTADAIVAALEAAGIGCWAAPRDIQPGTPYAEAIIDAIDQSQLMVVVFSSASNRSPHVSREVEQAASAGKPIVPVRIADVPPSKAMRYFLSTPHWLNAFPGPLEPHLAQLAATARELLAKAEMQS